MLLLLLVPGCLAARPGPPAAGALAPPPLTAAAQLGPDSVTVFTDGGAATAALVAAVASARRSIDAEIYEFDRRELVDAMVAAARRGVLRPHGGATPRWPSPSRPGTAWLPPGR